MCTLRRQQRVYAQPLTTWCRVCHALRRPLRLGKLGFRVCSGRPIYYHSVKRDLLQCQKRPLTVSKETSYSVKRDLLQCQKRPLTVSKETSYSVKRDLLQCQKRPLTVSKETYYSVHLSLHVCVLVDL